jgi:hypothetical protein
MESLIPSASKAALENLLSYVKNDTHAELECKVLSGKIQTKDVAERIINSIKSSARGFTEEHRATFSYPDGLRVNVSGAENIHKVCTTGSFRGVPLNVERKRRYFEVVTAGAGSDQLEIPDLNLKFTLRHEEPLRKDFSGAPMDPSSHVRILHRKSWTSTNGAVRYDFSMVKSKTKQTKTFSDILKQTAAYELEVELVNRKEVDTERFLDAITPLLGAFQGSEFLLGAKDIEKYRTEFEAMRVPFLNPVTMERRHISRDRPNNILSGYTVTNKADGERCFLVILRDRRVLRITPSNKIMWTGITAEKEIHVGTVLDGEYLADLNQFCIFDTYFYRGKDVRRLPLFTKDEDMSGTRLGCANSFIEDLATDFSALPAQNPFRIETKMFLAGNGRSMEKAIRTLLETKFEYATDGLIFTPRTAPVGSDRRGNVWTTVYKWKPPTQNSIDFLVRTKPGESFDLSLGKRVINGTLYVSRSPGDIVRPCETMTGEYVEPPLPLDLAGRDRVPTPFLPMVPRSTTAQIIMIPLNERGVPVDTEGNRVDDNTIIECSYDTEHGRWNILRTRHDKTYQYRVLNKPQYGNDIAVAESIWTNIHVPITEQMIREVHSNPPDDTFEDDLYYRDNLDARDRILKDVYGFHNRIKDGLYRSCVKKDDTLMELAVGRGGDLLKWKRTKPSLVVGFDLSSSCINSPRQGACVRYLREKATHPTEYLPPALFICGDMTKPLIETSGEGEGPSSLYAKILAGTEPATTPYLEKFKNVKEFDTISCQFAIHYACESDASFKIFLDNLDKHGKGYFFGTCLDGTAVYSLLMAKKNHIFRARGQVFGEFVKQYDDGEGWKEEFGQAISVHLESFEQPQVEYLVPFAKVTQELAKIGYELVGSTTFEDHYSEQTGIALTEEQKVFSFLHRSFVFQRTGPREEVQKVEVPMIEEEVPAEAPVVEAAAAPAAPRKKKIVKNAAPAAPGQEPVLFFGADEGKGEYRAFSNMYEAPFQVDSVTFPTVEHYFQWSKAKKFGDAATQDKIMKTKSAKSVKALGKKASGFNPAAWDSVKDDVMRTAVKAKITQHPEIKATLVNTGVRPIGEANPRDKYWGIGTSVDQTKSKDPSKWPGKNMLGKILEQFRGELKE